MQKSTHSLLYLFTLVFILTLSFISYYVYNPKPIVTCQPTAFNLSAQHKYYTHPQQLVIQPWRGQHNVYAIFLLPRKYKPDSLFTFTIPKGKTYCGGYRLSLQTLPGMNSSEYLTIKAYLNTRTAVKLILQGNLYELQQPNNWQLGYIKN